MAEDEASNSESSIGQNSPPEIAPSPISVGFTDAKTSQTETSSLAQVLRQLSISLIEPDQSKKTSKPPSSGHRRCLTSAGYRKTSADGAFSSTTGSGGCSSQQQKMDIAPTTAMFDSRRRSRTLAKTVSYRF
jgi:hypothetical protein